MEQTTTSQKKKTWVICGVVYAVVMLLVLLIANLDLLNAWLGDILTILRPVIIGLILAYLCNPLFRLFERKLFYKVRPISLRRVLALIFTYLVVFLIIVFFLLLLIPQLATSILNFLENFDNYLVNLIGQINELILSFNDKFAKDEPIIHVLDAVAIRESIQGFFSSIDSEFVMALFKKVDLVTVGTFIQGIFDIIIDIIFGFFISLYLLSSKEKRYAQIMRFRRAVFSKETNERITKVIDTTNRSFGGFFRGKLLDSFIIAILVFIAISIFGIEYPLLIATIIGITDIIPIIGPIIGVFPAGIIILLTQPEKVIPFIIIIILVQQLDGNIISPKILGENTGISSLCVLIAITTMGSLCGFAGMIIGVPLFATILEITDSYLEKRLKKKGRSYATDDYYESDPLSQSEHGKKKRFINRYKNKMIRLKQESLADGGIGDLTRFEKIQLETYNLACKYNIFSEYTDESLAQFAAEEAAIAATIEQVKASNESTEQTDTVTSQKNNEALSDDNPAPAES